MTSLLITNQELTKKTVHIQPEYADLFAKRIYNWYEAASLLYASRRSYLPPNLFELCHYSNKYTQAIKDVFIASETGRFAHEGGKPVVIAFAQSMSLFEDNFLPEHVEYDVELFLNAAKLFYCYKDDAHDKVNFYNMPVVEVW